MVKTETQRTWINESLINHDVLLNWVGNKHIDHSVVSITGAGLLAGQGGDLTASRIFTLNNSDIDHNALTNYVADEHIDWTNASDDFLTSGSAQASSIGLGVVPKSDIQLSTIYSSISSDDYFGIGTNFYYSGGWKRLAASNPASIIYFKTTGAIGIYTQSDANNTVDSAITFSERFSFTNAGRFGVNTIGPAALVQFNQSAATAAVPTLMLNQVDISEGFIDFIGSDRGVILGVTDSVGSVRIEVNGVVRRLAAYADA